MQQRTSVEIQAYSVDEAVRLALEQLALPEDAVDIEILSDAGPDEDAEALVRVTAKGHASQPVPSAKGATAHGGEHRDRGDRPRRRGRGGRGSGTGSGGNSLLGGRAPGDRPSQRGTPPRPVDRADAEDERVAKEVVADLLRHMGLTADVIAVDNPSSVPLDDEEPPTIFIDILGNDLGMLIGRRGDHLAQVQYLANMIVNRRIETWTRVVLDVEGYRTRREESIVALAERVARQVARSRKPVELEPMPPNERRIVHLTLRQHPEVTTHSSGEGNLRHITVEPRA
ncbi:MAG TPA: RNA-binding cell elongation regulator Jag/EloR [Thermomicrobiales bacterium]|jgi:spoIIIJ-associated protein|nr:RNA-binding cell elongation regulator Jag/EloR [Thermomicrobiales bacterium]